MSPRYLQLVAFMSSLRWAQCRFAINAGVPPPPPLVLQDLDNLLPESLPEPQLVTILPPRAGASPPKIFSLNLPLATYISSLDSLLHGTSQKGLGTFILMSSIPTPTELYRRPSDDPPKGAKKGRTSRPKVRSGCITCKTRHVKCDETKPECLRCLKFGRACDGYPSELQSRAAILPLKPRVPSVSSSTPSASIHATDEEARYFQLFSERTSYELSGYFDATFWTRTVLQEGYRVAAVKYAIIAIGALNKSLDNAPAPNLKVNIIQNIDKYHHEYAVLQYLKAIRALNDYISESEGPQIRTALIACVLFICFETFQASYASSVQQTYGGLKLLRSYYAGNLGLRPWIPQGASSEYGETPPGSGSVVRDLQTQLGGYNGLNASVITMHLKEYLTLQNSPLPDSEVNLTSTFRFAAQEAFPTLGWQNANKPSNELAGTHTWEEMGHNIAYSASTSRQSPQPSLAPSIARRTSSATSAISTPSSIYARTPSPTMTAPAQPPPTNSDSYPGSRTSTPTILQNDVSVEEILIQTFVRIDGPSLFSGLSPRVPPLIWDIHRQYHLPIPSSFSNFHSARTCWDFLMDRVLQFCRGTLFNRVYAPHASHTPSQIIETHASYLAQISAFESAFSPILKSSIQRDGTVFNPAAVILSLYLKCTSITLASIRNDSEMVYDAFLEDFKYITRTCSILLSSANQHNLPRNPRFSFEVGIIPPLHLTAIKCRDPVIRREAIQLLWASQRQEGIWDSLISARIGSWIIECEEDELPPPPLPVSTPRRVSDIRDEAPLQDTFSYSSGPPHLFDDPVYCKPYEGSSTQDAGAAALGDNEYSVISQLSTLLNIAGVPKVVLESSEQIQSTSSGWQGVLTSHPMEMAAAAPVTDWIVPKENRVCLLVMDFHIPDRYVKVKCQKMLVREDGKREERERVFVW